MLPAYADPAEQLEDVVRHPGGQIHGAEVVVNFDATDAGAVEAGFVGDRTDDVSWFDSMHSADFYAEGLCTRRITGFASITATKR